MPYTVELMSIGKDVYPLLQRCAATFNGLQSEFVFKVTPPDQRGPGLMFRRDEYMSTDVWKFLEAQRRDQGGRRPHIIAFIDRSLRSPRLQNLFGSTQAEKGLAVVTTKDFSQYVKEEERYCEYYLVRYCLSFVNPAIKSHTDPARANCYFNRKIHKQEIRLSMDSGDICDECRARLERPLPTDGGTNALSPPESAALDILLQYVARDLPYALVMKGGGVKGLAYAGALLELGRHFSFDRHVGTSAGSIAAVLLAAGYKPEELSALLREKDFKDFLDAPWWRFPLNLAFSVALHPGRSFETWMADLLKKKLGTTIRVKMKAVSSALIFASRASEGSIAFDSRGERQDTDAAFAVRCSMSIPILFYPTTVDGQRVFDGGMRANFPLREFLAREQRKNFIALFLSDPGKPETNVVDDLLGILLQGDERQLVAEYEPDIVLIDTHPVGFADFSLSPLAKEFLIEVGRAAALEFLLTRNVDNGPTAQECQRQRQKAEELRGQLLLTA